MREIQREIEGSGFTLNFDGAVLDIGFGLGYFIEALARTMKKIGANGKIFRIDHSNTMVLVMIHAFFALIISGLTVAFFSLSAILLGVINVMGGKRFKAKNKGRHVDEDAFYKILSYAPSDLSKIGIF